IGSERTGTTIKLDLIAAPAFPKEHLEGMQAHRERSGGVTHIVRHSVVGVIGHHGDTIDLDPPAVVGTESEGIDARPRDLDETRGPKGIRLAADEERGVGTVVPIAPIAEIVYRIRR